MPRPTTFTKLNSLTLDKDGVFRANTLKEINYSDGERSEQYLREILSSADDLSSSSLELQSHIKDWPTEYHLSSERANLMRALNLQGVTKILELGCGCGSISRFLGEQSKVEVDSIEGSRVRASLAALRCRDLDRVTVSCGNFNQMTFPENHYDLVLFVGVTEYAGRFSDQKSDQQALQDLLTLASRALSPDGAVIIAIENRTGLKYMLGASEDHYGEPYIGIDNYPNSTGIRTYHKGEWQALINQSSFTDAHFVYPFPDYKVPTLMVSEQCDQGSPQLYNALTKIKSRDYLTEFDLGENESRLWQTVLETETLDKFSNSFLIALANNGRVLDELIDFNIREYPQVDVGNERAKKVGDKDKRESDHVSNERSVQRIERLRNDLKNLQLHSTQLQQRVDLLISSRGWKMLSRIRRFFGMPTI